MKLIVGLGNLGPQYARTRHNVGFMVADRLAAAHGRSWQTEAKFMAAINELTVGEERIILAQPHTMMNLSGEAAQRLMHFYKIEPQDVWAIYDDVDVPFGRMRLRVGGGSSGHQGVNSLIRHLGTGFVRVRMGISLNDRSTEPSEVYVLKPFKPEEQQLLPKALDRAAQLLYEQLSRQAPEETTFDLVS